MFSTDAWRQWFTYNSKPAGKEKKTQNQKAQKDQQQKRNKIIQTPHFSELQLSQRRKTVGGENTEACKQKAQGAREKPAKWSHWRLWLDTCGGRKTSCGTHYMKNDRNILCNTQRGWQIGSQWWQRANQTGKHMLWPTFKQSQKTPYRLGSAGAKQTREAVWEKAKSRKHITQTPTLHKKQMSYGWWMFRKGKSKKRG